LHGSRSPAQSGRSVVLILIADEVQLAGLDRLVAQIDDQLAKSGVERVEAVH
jgi:hypothetical protein